MCDNSQPPTILYIEDNRDNRMLVRRVLEVEGYEVIEAENAPRGIEIARTTHPSLVLMDINLPDMDGYEATSILRTLDGWQDIPIIALTANVMRGDRERTMQAGCSGYIPKPVDVDRLPEQVASFLEKK